jgi:hypothetical protein
VGRRIVGKVEAVDESLLLLTAEPQFPYPAACNLTGISRLHFSPYIFTIYITVTFLGCDYRRGYGLVTGLTTYIHHSELQVITALLLISTLHKSPQHPLNIFQLCVFIGRSPATAFNSRGSSASQPPVELNPQPTTDNHQL